MRRGPLMSGAVAMIVVSLTLAACQAPGRVASDAAGTGMVSFNAALTGTQCVPSVDTQGLGAGVMTYDPATKELRWTIAYDRLSSPATAAHFHGPADPASNAGVAVPIAGPGMTGPITGSATLSEAQAAELLAGLWYVNVHSATYPGGEIRGQVQRAR